MVDFKLLKLIFLKEAEKFNNSSFLVLINLQR